jgi:hypothetical protein
MGKLNKLAYTLRSVATKMSDADALLSFDLGRIARRAVNKAISKGVRGATNGLFLKPPKKRRK